MSPILIDNRGLIKLGLISGLVSVLIFVIGIFIGFQRATIFYQSASEIVSLSLPEKIASINGDIEPQMPEIIEAGEEIDVDQLNAQARSQAKATVNIIDQEILKQMSNQVVDKKTSTKKAILGKDRVNIADIHSNNIQAVNSTSAKNENSEVYTDAILASKTRVSKEKTVKASNSAMIVSAKNSNSLSIKENITSINSQHKDNFITAQKIQPTLAIALPSDELSKIKYSIQVGMYGRLINAENMMNMLQAKRLDAYVSDYTNKKNEIRYNVRFGYFTDKKTAVTALESYKNSQKGDGYLVRFSAKNITSMAGAENLKDSTTVEKTEQNLPPMILPVEISQEKVSQAEVYNTSNELTKIQTKIITN